MPLPLVLRFASRGLKPPSIMRARLQCGTSWVPSGATSRKRRDTSLKFASCVKRRWMSSAQRREGKAVAPPDRATVSLAQPREPPVREQPQADRRREPHGNGERLLQRRMPRVERRHQEHTEERRDAKVVPERRGILRRATKARLRASSTRYWRPSRRMRRRLKARFRAPCHAPWPPFPKDAAAGDRMDSCSAGDRCKGV